MWWSDGYGDFHHGWALRKLRSGVRAWGFRLTWGQLGWGLHDASSLLLQSSKLRRQVFDSKLQVRVLSDECAQVRNFWVPAGRKGNFNHVSLDDFHDGIGHRAAKGLGHSSHEIHTGRRYDKFFGWTFAARQPDLHGDGRRPRSVCDKPALCRASAMRRPSPSDITNLEKHKLLLTSTNKVLSFAYSSKTHNARGIDSMSTKPQTPPIGVRLQPALRDYIETQAKENFRSVSAEIAMRLERSRQADHQPQQKSPQ